ncbi:MAG: hypothetical protein IKD78_14660, partial [Bacteroidales bacterium]|nr:hypothetical protein [Bacteroidales bacterium]
MSYAQYTFYQKLIVPVLLVLFLLLSVVGYGQNNEDCPSCHDCTHLVDTIISKLNIPDTICAGSTNIYTIGYDTTKDIVIAAQEPRIDSAERMFIGSSSCNNNDCKFSSTINFSGYSGIVQDASNIKYIKLNMEFTMANYLNIRIVCPDGNSSNILSPDNLFINTNCGYITSAIDNYPDWLNLGNPIEDVEDTWDCDTTNPINLPGIGWNYCWTSNQNYSPINFYENNFVNIPNNESYSFDSSNVYGLTHFYIPDEDFFSLEGCHVNGPWTIEIINYEKEGPYNGYLFDWEIKFEDGVLQPAGNSVNGAAVLTADGQVDTNFDVSNFSEGDSTIVFTAPMVTQNDTLTRTLQLYDSTTRCWYDREFTVVVMAPEGTRYDTSVCAGESITLEAYCDNGNSKFHEGFEEASAGGDIWHSHSTSNSDHDGPITNSEISESVLSNFPIRSKVFSAGGKVKLGNGDTIGSMTSVPMNLTNPFSVLIRAKGWGSDPTSTNPPKKTMMNVVVDKGMSTQQEHSFETTPAYHWPGTDAYRNYSLAFDGATDTSTITIETVAAGTNYHKRAFVDYVKTNGNNCTYHWSDGTNNWGNDSINPTITVSPSETTTYYVTVTPPGGGCVRVDTFVVGVKHPQHQAFPVTECESYTWENGDGETYTASGDYTYSHEDDNNCTQVDTLHLTINNPQHQHYEVTACESYTWENGNGETYTASGDYTYSHEDNNNCT